MKRFTVIMFMLFGNCLGMTMVLDNDDDSDNESIGYSDEQEVRIEQEIRIIVPRIRRIQAKAIHCLKTLPPPGDEIAEARFNRCENFLEASLELERGLNLSVSRYRNFLISFEELLDEFSAISADVTMMLLSLQNMHYVVSVPWFVREFEKMRAAFDAIR